MIVQEESAVESNSKLAATQFRGAIKPGVTLVDFNAPWCGPCLVQETITKQLAKQFEGKVSITEVNVDENRQTAINLGVHSIPTLILFKDGQEIQRFIGLQSADVLSRAIEKALRRPAVSE